MLLANMETLKIVGNAIAIVGMCLFFLSAFFKTTKKVLFTQSIAHVVNIASWICTGLYPATIGEGANIIRNGFIIKNKNTRVVSIIIIIVSTILGILVSYYSKYEDTVFLNADQMYWLGYFPVFISLVFSIVVLFPNCPIEATKGAMIFSTSCFAIYSILGGNFVMGAGNTLTALTTAISLFKIVRGKRNNNSTPENENTEERSQN